MLMGAGVDVPALIAHAILELVIPDLAHNLLVLLTGQRLFAVQAAQLDKLIASPFMAAAVNRRVFALIGGILFHSGMRMGTGVYVSAAVAHAILEPVPLDFARNARHNLLGQRRFTIFTPYAHHPLAAYFMRNPVNGSVLCILQVIIVGCRFVRAVVHSTALITSAILTREVMPFKLSRLFRVNDSRYRLPAVFAEYNRHEIAEALVILIVHGRVFCILHILVTVRVRMHAAIVGRNCHVFDDGLVLSGSFAFFLIKSSIRGCIVVLLTLLWVLTHNRLFICCITIRCLFFSK